MKQPKVEISANELKSLLIDKKILSNYKVTGYLLIDKRITTITNCEFEDVEIRIKNTSQVTSNTEDIPNLLIDSCEFKGLRLYKPESNIIHIHKCRIKYLIVGNNENMTLRLSDVICELYQVFDSKISRLLMYRSDIKTLDIEDTNISNELYIDDTKIDKANIRKAQIEELALNKITTNYFFVDCSLPTRSKDEILSKNVKSFLNKITFESAILAKDSQINFTNLKLKEMNFFSFTNPATIKFRNINFEPTAEVNVYHSDLGKMDFSNVDFRNAKIQIANTHLVDCLFSNIEWSHEHFDVPKGINDVNKAKLLRETYRQLKYANEKQGNRIAALEFYRKEMEMHWKYVWAKKKKSWDDITITYPNKFASNFGQRFWQPVAWMLIIHLALFTLLIWLNDMSVGIGYKNASCEGFWNAVALYFNTLIPVHKLEDVNGKTLVSTTDFFIRLSSSFFLYHIITASRKFMNK